MMKSVIGKNWRDAATLIVLSRSNREATRLGGRCNYDILLQTRTDKATFKNSVVFPGGVTEAADASPEWLQLLKSFGYLQEDFNSLHHPTAPIPPILQNNPVERHISLRITAIRETFEELGLLICSRAQKEDRNSIWASFVTDIDFKQWQKRVSKDPSELLCLCKENNCYPDIWSLYFLSNWLTPARFPKRFDAAFFLTSLDTKPLHIKANTEVKKYEWLTPNEILEQNKDLKVLLWPPQSYELNRLARWPDLEEVTKFAKERSSYGNDLFYYAAIRASDGFIFAYRGDELYPPNVDYNATEPVLVINKTILELRESSQKAHRFEIHDSARYLVVKNVSFGNMHTGEIVIPLQITIT